MNANTRNILIAAVLLPIISYGISYQHQVVRQQFEDAAKLKAEVDAEWKRNFDRDIEAKVRMRRLVREAEEERAENAATEARMAAYRIEQDKQRKIDADAKAIRDANIAAVLKERGREMETIRLDIACQTAAIEFRKQQDAHDAAAVRAKALAAKREQDEKKAIARAAENKKAEVKAAALKRQETLKGIQSQKQGQKVVVPSRFGN
jgi:hypothetical protein